ncbi:MAG: phage terminase large subunit [Alistipes sp.]|jgi:predicted phage terminase large subunit-like protein|nr:phage terminase large subunit [Alistipes sp.]
METRLFHDNYYRLLDAFALGRVRHMIVTMPPQHGKSHGASVLLPAYILGLDPDRRIAIASYSASLASRFNRRVQRLIESPEYAAMFPQTTIKGAAKSSKDTASYIRTSDHVEIVGHEGELFSVGREGPLTGNRVDTFIIDDLYKDAMEANSPVVRDNCREWYTSVVRTRMHNDSTELIVNTRWHDEDLIGVISEVEEVRTLERWSDLDDWPPEVWLHLNLEALKNSPPTQIDPRAPGEPLWPERHSRKLLLRKRALDPLQFECMYQGNPSPAQGLLYGEGIATYDEPPARVVARNNYTDTADMGDDYLCSVCYQVGADGLAYVTDVVYTPEPMEVTETLVSEMLARTDTRLARVESNNGGRGFARAVERLSPGVAVEWFHQSDNKEARILSNSATVTHRIRMPADWARRWPAFHDHLSTYRRLYRANRLHDAADVLTGIVECEFADTRRRMFRMR